MWRVAIADRTSFLVVLFAYSLISIYPSVLCFTAATMPQTGKKLTEEPIHLGSNATAQSLSAITGKEWYEQYAKQFESDGKEGRLLSIYTFEKSWDVWEMHPVGEEVVLCTAGSVTLLQDATGEQRNIVETVLKAGEYAINPKGTWHTANVDHRSPCTVVFVTPGMGTQLKPRSTTEKEL